MSTPKRTARVTCVLSVSLPEGVEAYVPIPGQPARGFQLPNGDILKGWIQFEQQDPRGKVFTPLQISEVEERMGITHPEILVQEVEIDPFIEDRKSLPKTLLNEEVVLPLPDGWTLRSGKYPESTSNLLAGEYVRLCDPDGNETAYWDQEEWRREPALVMGAILNSAANIREEESANPNQATQTSPDSPRKLLIWHTETSVSSVFTDDPNLEMEVFVGSIDLPDGYQPGLRRYESPHDRYRFVLQQDRLHYDPAEIERTLNAPLMEGDEELGNKSEDDEFDAGPE